MVPMNNRIQSTRARAMCSHRRARRRGFILLMALVLIALVGLILVGLARHSLLLAAESQEARAELQRRWATVLLARTVLSDPETLISRHLATGHVADAADVADVAEVQLPISETMELGGITFQVTLDDENRKLNVNRLRAAAGTPKTLEVLHRLGGGGAQVDLKPAVGNRFGVQEFDSWGHVLRIPPTCDAHEQFQEIRPLAECITCWGSAKVNVHRCSQDILHRVGSVAAGPITANKLVALRDGEPDLDAEALITKLAIPRRKQALLKGWLSDRSDCYSLWILAGERRSSLDLYLRENSGSESYSIAHFQW